MVKSGIFQWERLAAIVMQMRSSILDHHRKNNIKTKRMTRITIAVLILFFLCLLAGKGLWEQSRGRVYYGERRTWKYWTDCLISKAQDRDYAYAFVWADDKKADFSWEFFDNRDSLIEDLAEKKEDMQPKEKNAALWCFVKLRLDEDIYGTDIYEYIKQNLSEDGFEYYACTFPDEEGKIPDKDRPYYIEQVHIEEHFEQEYPTRFVLPKREAVICDGYLYFLACGDVTEINQFTVAEQMIQFRDSFDSIRYGMAYELNENRMYWMEHTSRESRSENPECIFTEERANALSTDGSDWGEWEDYFGLMKDAEYRIELFPGMKELSIHFRYAGEAEEGNYEFYLEEGKRNTDQYQMEVRMADDGRLLQEESVQLSIWKTDMIRFEDLDGDGYLDMKVIYPEYSGFDDELTVCDEVYGLWNQDTEEFEFVKRTAFLAGQEENGMPSAKEEADAEQEAGQQTETAVDVPIKPYIVTVEDGDSLWRLAENYYGEGRYWEELYENNRITIGADPSLILPGMEFEIRK